MKQIIQDLSSGATELVECPPPVVRRGQLLIDTTASLISAGTERMLVDFGRSSLIAKARQQPDKVAQVLAKVRTDGLLATFDAVRSTLHQPIPLGYCNVGVVRAAGEGVDGFRPGDRVVSNGPHADVVSVPKNLCVRIPNDISDEAAAFAVVGAIGLQGLRLAKPALGEVFVVTGAGLIGLLTIQLLRAHGCRVLAIDFDSARLELAAAWGAEICNLGAGDDPLAAGSALSRGMGVDGVIITASTRSSDPVAQAAQMCRKRGRIVLVGVTGLELKRSDFYQKELSFQVSCSYGPGRYDPAYEEQGHDYPFGFVRWTEKRNIEAVLDLMSAGGLDVSRLVSHRFPFEQATQAYDLLAEDQSGLGIVLTYDHPVEARHTSSVQLMSHAARPSSNLAIGLIGAGNYASRVLIPAFKAAGAQLHTIVSAGGVSSAVQGSRGGFATATSDLRVLLDEAEIAAVAIATRHNTHASLTIDSLLAGKHVFVEKPLALTLDELASLEEVYSTSERLLMVGFNRRFAPLIRRMKALLDCTREPKAFVMVMNAGKVPADHWTLDAAIGGGRIIGEACHLIDLMRHLAGTPITRVSATGMRGGTAAVMEDKVSIALSFADGSFGTVHYLANGAQSFPKERIEVFVQGRTLQLDNFRVLRGFDWPGFRKEWLWKQDKGQRACAAAFLKAVQNGGQEPIPSAELFEVSRVAIKAADAVRCPG